MSVALAAAKPAIESCPGCQVRTDFTKAEQFLKSALPQLGNIGGPSYALEKINSVSALEQTVGIFVINADVLDADSKKKTCDISLEYDILDPTSPPTNSIISCPGEKDVVVRARQYA